MTTKFAQTLYEVYHTPTWQLLKMKEEELLALLYQAELIGNCLRGVLRMQTEVKNGGEE